MRAVVLLREVFTIDRSATHTRETVSARSMLRDRGVTCVRPDSSIFRRTTPLGACRASATVILAAAVFHRHTHWTQFERDFLEVSFWLCFFETGFAAVLIVNCFIKCASLVRVPYYLVLILESKGKIY